MRTILPVDLFGADISLIQLFGGRLRDEFVTVCKLEKGWCPEFPSYADRIKYSHLSNVGTLLFSSQVGVIEKPIRHSWRTGNGDVNRRGGLSRLHAFLEAIHRIHASEVMTYKCDPGSINVRFAGN